MLFYNNNFETITIKSSDAKLNINALENYSVLSNMKIAQEAGATGSGRAGASSS